MKIYIDFSKQTITKIDNSVAYVGDVYSNVFELLFFNYGDAVDWFPTMSQLAPNGREAGDFNSDALDVDETYEHVENGITYMRYTFTIGEGWVRMKGRSNFFIWVNKLIENYTALQRKCYGKISVVLNESTDNYFIQDLYFNPKVKEYIDNTIGDDLETYKSTIDDEVEAQNEAIDNLLGGTPQVFDTANNIQLLQENKGVAVATDTGQIWYWNGSAYANSGITYQATVITDGSVTTESLDDDLKQSLFNEVYNDITADCDVETGYYINHNNGNIESSGSGYLSDYIDLTETGPVYISGKSQYATCLYATYDSGKNLIATGGYDGNNEVIWTRERIEATGNIVYARCCSYQAPLVIEASEYVSKVDEALPELVINEEHLENITTNYELSNNYIDKRNGTLVSNNNSKTTPLIPCSTSDTFYITGHSRYDTCLIATYNASNQFLRYYGNTTSDSYVYKDYQFIPQSDEKYVRFCTYDYAWYPLVIKKAFSSYTLKNKVIDLSNKTNLLNVLYGKKYVACGDSFTAGDNLTEDKTYPNLIATRNNMLVKNMGRNGGYVHYDSTSASFLNSGASNYYQRIPRDADYITIAFGLNELNQTLGDSTSTDNTTIWGAYNEVLTWILTNCPNAKVGIISSDAWFTETFRDTLKDIAKYWGISFLDLKGEDVPLMIGGKYYDVSASAVSTRNTMYQISSTNRHPNELGQKIRSYIIENWLRTI